MTPHELLESIVAASNNDPNGSGGGSTVTGTAVETTLDKYVPEKYNLALCYGQHLIAGSSIYQEYSAGPPPLNKLAIALGDAGPLGWQGPVKIWWAGEELSASPDDSTVGYHFHPGYWPEDDTDSTHSGAQEPDSFFATAQQFSGTAYVGLRLTEVQSAQKTVDGHIGIYETQKVYDYDQNGVQSATASYSTNPAVIVADGFRRAGLLTRIDWPSWYAWKTFCDETISWDDGDSVRSIARFEAHPVWTSGRVSLPELIEAVTLAGGATAQDDGALVRFKLITDQVPVHHFSTGEDLDNKRGWNSYQFKLEPDGLRDRINRLRVTCRDLDDAEMLAVTLTVEREDLIIRYGEVVQTINLPNMNQSQLRRIGQSLLYLGTDNPNKASLIGGEEGFHILVGDYVTVTNPVNGWDYQLCRVEAITDMDTSTRPGLRQYSLRAIRGPVYYDTDHKQRQQPEP